MPAIDWISMFLAINVFMGSLVCMLITLHFNNFKLANTMLLIYIGGMCIFIAMNFFNQSGLILYFPWLYRWPSFIYYLMPPAAFLYVKTIVNDQERLNKWDYLHFLPGLLHFVELIPYHLQPLSVKRDIVAHAMADQNLIYAFNEGVLPAYWHHFMRSFLGFGYGTAMLVKTFKLKQFRFAHALIPPQTLRWLFVFSGMILATATVVSLASILKLFFDISVFQFYTVGVSMIFLVSLYYMYFHPDILYGIPRITGEINMNLIAKVLPGIHHDLQNNPIDVDPEKLIEPSAALTMDYKTSPVAVHWDFDFLKQYQPILEEYLNNTQPFLRGGFSIREMSDETEIPQHHLSALLNKIYGLRFNDFINQYRIDYLEKRIAEGEYQNLSMDGIAEQAGFGSRGTLFNSIKKLKGMAPTEFFKMKKEKEA